MFLVAAAALVLAVIALSSRGSAQAAARPPAPAPAPAPAPRAQPIVPAAAPDLSPGRTIVVTPDREPASWAVDQTTHDGGVISPPGAADMGPRTVELIDTADLPPELLPIVQQAGSASVQDLERGALLAEELGFPDIADHLRLRVTRRTDFAQAQRAGTAPPPARDVPIRAVSFQPSALPTAHADRAELQRLATRLADNIRRSGARQYDRALLVRFQQAAGIQADGKYGRQSQQALGTYGHIPAGQLPPPQY